uniref:non-specific serine/threonine protein kinase n=1 Tax=Panagrolaimus davidi TaxID=227884 RepID=A0A914PIS2_9BILA
MPSPEDIANRILDHKTSLNVDGLLDAVIALYNDCNIPVLKRTQNIDAFLQRNQSSISHLENHRLKCSDFDAIKVIGRGAFGEVRLVRQKVSRKVFALKLLNKNEMLRRADTAFFWEERDIMAYSESEWIVRLHYAFQDMTHLYMVMEYMPGGDVANLMLNYEISEEWARFYVAELVLALDALHSMGYIHRDVKPDNILISSTGHIKLADFGSCVKIGDDGFARCSSAVGTPDYISPEMLEQQGTEGIYGKELDWWSVGILLYELLIGEPPFYADSIPHTYARIMNHSTNLFFPEDIHISDAVKDLIQQFLSDAKIRLGRNGIQEVKNHRFFKNEKWTFDNIQHSTPPYVPTLNGDDDTSHFEDFDDQNEADVANGFSPPKAFTGNQLPFIGFTYSNELGPIAALKSTVLNGTPSTSNVSSFEINSLVIEKQQLEDRLQDVQNEFSNVQNQLQTEREQMELKMKEIRRLEVDIAKGYGQELELKLANERISEMQAADERASKQIRELLNVVKTLKSRNSDLEAQTEKYHKEETAAVVENQKLKSEILNLKTVNEKCFYRIKGLNDKIESLSRELNEEATFKLEIGKREEEEKHCLTVTAED